MGDWRSPSQLVCTCGRTSSRARQQHESSGARTSVLAKRALLAHQSTLRGQRNTFFHAFASVCKTLASQALGCVL